MIGPTSKLPFPVRKLGRRAPSPGMRFLIDSCEDRAVPGTPIRKAAACHDPFSGVQVSSLGLSHD